MPTGRAVTVAAIIVTIALIPIITILVLGLYGFSITGDFPLADDDGPTIRVEPKSGPPGAQLAIRGTLATYDIDTFDLKQQVTLGIRINDIATVSGPA